MIRADEDIMKAFQTAPGYRIMEFLDKCLKDQDKKLRVAEGPEMYRAQGAANELDEIVTLAKKARDN